ncbi:thiamine pyrophosphate-dependent acetolactate synthase large subunit-like protein [Homoserinimonas aerilata]|uniref:Thiamine pyrophosphate-dependent acetolactate synthase large subunit-like protein n=1 Tax=Homoserinimonas aerilata TaxID=1162970 RepID=A0A542Y1I5_9MICO|nr:thiamine pyrophosphate-binding protein [Homoserinimonas aerilata]TQL41948.1 thiamine pyrophosphate-dependent acetolactate synthase large subunit-like protein [Homoserinimonas aerilata]
MKVSEAVGRALVQWGVDQVFGVAGSGNFEVTTAMVDAGAKYVSARHEGGAASMADGYARLARKVTVASVHQGPGLTNALTGLAEAVKAHTPLIMVAGETPATMKTSNFWIDQASSAEALGAVAFRLESPATALADAARAFTLARTGQPVLLGLPLDVQAGEIDWNGTAPELPTPASPPAPSADAVAELVSRLSAAQRPLVVGGRGAFGAHDELVRLAEASGALLATSAMARGLFNDDPWNVDVMGGFANESMSELIQGADLIVAFGASLNRWTSRNGELIGDTPVIQVDANRAAFSLHRPVTTSVIGDAALVAVAVAAALPARGDAGYRTPETAEKLATGRLWRDQPFEARTADDRIDPRSLAVALDELLPNERVVTADAGSHTEYTAMYLQVPDDRGYCLPLGFQCIGLALASSIGAAVAQPDRLPVAGIGDGGFMMSLVELDTAVRLGLPLVVVVYNDSAYGAEVHHFGHSGQPLDIVEFPDTDIAAIARGFGCDGITVRSLDDLSGLRDWLDGDRTRPIVIDAKTISFPSWVDAHAFVGEPK